MEVVILNREDSKNFIKSYDRGLSDSNIKDHPTCEAQWKGVSWLNLLGIIKTGEIPPKGVTLVELANTKI